MSMDMATRAADKLAAELEEIKKIKPRDARDYENVKLTVLGPPICETLTRFVYQNELFAAAVVECDKTLADCIRKAGEIITKDNPNVDGTLIYAAAVKFYVPRGEIRCSFRIEVPSEEDDDLFDVNSVAAVRKDSGNGQKRAIVLDLFGTGEE